MDNAKNFFEEIIRTEEAKKIFSNYKKPETIEETVKIYIKVAGELGIELTEEEIKEYLSAKEASGQLDDEELSQLSGGGDHPECKDTFKDKENCWWDDACDLINSYYEGYDCKHNVQGASWFHKWDM